MILTGTGIPGSQRPPTFTFTVNTSIAGTSGVGKFQLPLTSFNSGSLNAIVDWGDGTTDSITTAGQAEALHTYPSPGAYTIRITGVLSGWRFNNGGDRLKMLDISSWGSLHLGNTNAFFGCNNMTCSAVDAPTIITDILSGTFVQCFNFNGAIGNWNLSGVTRMFQIFQECFLFNQPLGNWNMSSVIRTESMFRSCSSFNQDIGGWNLSSLQNMSGMFFNAFAFNQDIGSWDVGNVTSANDFMAGKTEENYSAANLDSIYNGWGSRPVSANLNINFNTIKYTAAGQAGRDVLTGAPNNWTIADGGI